MSDNWFEARKVGSNVFAIAEFMHWEKAISYLVLGKTKAYLVDTGMGYESIACQVSKITHLPVEVLLTHSHWDHIGGVNLFDKVNVYNDPFEIDLLEKGFNSLDIDELQDQNLFEKPFRPLVYISEGKFNYKTFKDNALFREEEFSIQTIHTPGHTPGSTTYYSKELNCLFVGDLLYPGPIYVNLAESDFEMFCQSTFKLSRVVNAETVVYPGHNCVKIDSSLIFELNELCNLIKEEKVEGTVNNNTIEFKLGKLSILKSI